MIFDARHTDDLLSFLDASPSPYHAVEGVCDQLNGAGFLRVSEVDDWPVSPGGQYIARGGTLIAWIVPESAPPHTPFRIVAAHTDSPNLRLKPRPDTGHAGWRQARVEVYGAAPLDSWLDRDLGLSGRLALRDGSTRLVRMDRPLLRIPRLAGHLAARGHADVPVDPQLHMSPVWGLGEAAEGELIGLVAAEAGVAPNEVLGADLMCHDVQPPARLGRLGELIAAARLDDLVAVHAGAVALAALAVSCDGPCIPVFAAFDHEEVGSISDTGARGSLLSDTIARIVSVRGGDGQDLARALADSLCLSVDLAHAVHPNHADRHDANHWPVPNAGPVVKVSAGRRYATEAISQAAFVAACERAGVPHQVYVANNAVPGGGSIGPFVSARLGVPAVDVGVAGLSMHSARELCGAADPYLLAAALTEFLTA